MNKTSCLRFISFITVLLSSTNVLAGEPSHALIEQAYFKCEQSKNLRGGIFGKGPLKKFGPEEAVCKNEEWVRITKAEFKLIATKWYGVNWTNEIPFWQTNE